MRLHKDPLKCGMGVRHTEMKRKREVPTPRVRTRNFRLFKPTIFCQNRIPCQRRRGEEGAQLALVGYGVSSVTLKFVKSTGISNSAKSTSLTSHRL